MSSGNACWIGRERGCSRGSFPAGWRRPEVDAEPTKRSDSAAKRRMPSNPKNTVSTVVRDRGSNPAPSTGESVANLTSCARSRWPSCRQVSARIARSSHGGPIVRIHLPPADSLVSRRNSPVTVEKPRFSASVAGRSSQRGRQRRARRGDMAPTGDNISVGSESGTAAPVMLVAVAIPWVL